MAIKKNEQKAEAADGKQPGFEKSLERLEEIVSEMEGKKLSLDEMIAKFEEGQSLIKFCSKKLNEVEKKIEMLIKKDGGIKAEPFDESSIGDDGNNDAEEKAPF